jgi:hypothetical protein
LAGCGDLKNKFRRFGNLEIIVALDCLAGLCLPRKKRVFSHSKLCANVQPNSPISKPSLKVKFSLFYWLLFLLSDKYVHVSYIFVNNKEKKEILKVKKKKLIFLERKLSPIFKN